MQNVAIVLVLLLAPYWGLIPAHVVEAERARVGVGLVFAFTGIGHFIKNRAMCQMLPAWVPARVALIYITGVFELAGAVAVLIPSLSRRTGIVLCVFLILILPSNVYAAIRRVEFGGHAAGPIYLLIRIPLQLFLIGWVYWFCVRQFGSAA
jgi:uncharacterized membrane protein